MDTMHLHSRLLITRLNDKSTLYKPHGAKAACLAKIITACLYDPHRESSPVSHELGQKRAESNRESK